ncbi:MAG: TerC family protein [Rhodospirillaceae bacterium]|jgi:predicted tellurium resistance membrane protein TerC|nr:TerC family protein [Rhodospirillaceae bacterium]MBT4773305.1 TerC family protein [Rhodospirillaceae bacterium]MBT5769936.1 TerC family protein [Rhodospirillaceae bacterium]MBT6309871.1 TerC family protein [Rhodospirillaceae bacterium]MBT6536931.1 TerC family protein [Rhodospirillaceae bacterium]
MLELLTDPAAWASLLTLTLLEVVLGVDNVIFLSIVTSRLPAAQQPRARRIGLILALGGRVVLLLALGWLIGLTAPLLSFLGVELSWRDLILAVGGLFLIYKATTEIHVMLEGENAGGHGGKPGSAVFAAVLVQIFLLDLVFSLDSVLTAIGMADEIIIMVAAVTIAIGVMIVAAEPLSAFVQRHPTVKMLALSFLLLIGVALIADGFEFHIPRGYLYFGVAFATAIEILNLIARKRRTDPSADTAG